MANRFTEKAQGALRGALNCARDMGHTYIGSEHLLLGLLSEPECIAARLLEQHGIRAEKTRQLLRARSGVGSASQVSAADMTPRAKKIIENAATESSRAGQGFIGSEHLLLALCRESESEGARLLLAQGVGADALWRDIRAYFGDAPAPRPPSARGSGDKGRERERSETPFLSAHARNLLILAREGRIDPVIGREDESERLIRILSRRTKNNPCLIGDPGVGKTAVVEGLARRIAEGSVPDTLRDRTILLLDLASMIAGAKYRGEFEERMRGVLSEATADRRIILFIDEIHTIIGAGGAEGALDAANILKPALARGEIQLIGATTLTEYRSHIERDAALARRFQSVLVEDPTPEGSVEILRGLRERYEAHHRLRITDEAIDAAVRLSVRYLTNRCLPDKAIDLIDEAAAKKRLEQSTPREEVRQIEHALRTVSAEKEEAILAEDYEIAASLRDHEKQLRDAYDTKRGSSDGESVSLTLTAEDVAETLSAWCGIPLSRLSVTDSDRLLSLETELRRRVIGQEEAVSAVARAIRRGRTGMRDMRRPLASFLFLGPSGVGKTELARTLADCIYGGEKALLRFDMSEYMERFTTSRLIGAPPGYVGSEDGGLLTDAVREKPYAVLLLDEIEKAHPDVFHLLLQIMEEGTLTDAQGHHVDFRNTVLIMTSNVGASSILSPTRLGFSDALGEGAEHQRMKENVRDALKEVFRPEFLNRIDEILTFRRLGDSEIREIASLLLADVTKRAAALGVSVHFSQEVTDAVARAGFDPLYGARPLRRTILRMIEDPLSEGLLRGTVHPGDRICARWEEGRVQFASATQ